MKPGVVYLLCCLTVYILPMISGQNDACDNMFSTLSDSVRSTTRGRRRDMMLSMSNGNPRTENCPFLRSAMTRSGGSNCESRLRLTCPVPNRAAPDATRGFAGLDVSVVPNACSTNAPVCNSTYFYRTIDGSCNNLKNPDWGQVGSQQRRLIQNAYDDGRGSPRNKGCNGGVLPDARTVSNNIHSAGRRIKFERFESLLLMQVGQFMVHDLVLTKTITKDDGSPLECCGVDRNNENCNPIIVPVADTHFSPGSCLDFQRSNAVTDCYSVRQVINSKSSWFDLSSVYGNSEDEAWSLRSKKGGGKLKQIQNKLPVDFTDSTCIRSRPFDPVNYYCPITGDPRVMAHPGTASMHTIFMREHNRLAEGLARVNPHWDDERLYQEARKINIGQWQHIMYSEYLPTVLGRGVIRRFNLQVVKRGFDNNYLPYVDGTVTNVFAVAAFRFGHSQAHDLLGQLDNFNQQSTQPLERHYFEPEWYHANNGTGLEHMLNWITKTSCPFTDRKLQDSVRQYLFLDSEGKSMDLAAVNIQRGRDHGTPGYTAFRRLCGLSDVRHFGTGQGGLVDHDLETARLLEDTYSCPSDIDLFTGMMSETRTGDGSLLGPTWQCLFVSEFRRLRNGDRFFYERWDPLNPEIGFTQAQLNSVKNIKISNIICQNTDIRSMQRYGLYKPDRGWNRLRSCRSFRGVDINLWRERTHRRYGNQSIGK